MSDINYTHRQVANTQTQAPVRMTVADYVALTGSTRAGVQRLLRLGRHPSGVVGMSRITDQGRWILHVDQEFVWRSEAAG